MARETTRIDFTLPNLNLSLDALNSSIGDYIPDHRLISAKVRNPLTIVDKFEPWGQGLKENEEKMSVIALDHQQEESDRILTFSSLIMIGIILIAIAGIITWKICCWLINRRRSTRKEAPNSVIIDLKTMEGKKTPLEYRKENTSDYPNVQTITTAPP